MHKYNNQDHAMMTAMLTARNILAGERRYDVWDVNEDAEYHEAGTSGAQAALAERTPRAGAGYRCVPGSLVWSMIPRVEPEGMLPENRYPVFAIML